jgi:hypothetical protein
MLEKTEELIKNGQSKDTISIGSKTQNQKKRNTED